VDTAKPPRKTPSEINHLALIQRDMVEPGGIEPPSASHQREDLHV